MLNKIFIMGRLTRDPELRRTQTGTPVASFSLAVDRDFKDKSTGERATDFIDVVAWRQTAEFVCRYFAKGRMAVVEGRLQIRDWTDKEGGKRRSAEVIASTSFEFQFKILAAEKGIKFLVPELVLANSVIKIDSPGLSDFLSHCYTVPAQHINV